MDEFRMRLRPPNSLLSLKGAMQNTLGDEISEFDEGLKDEFEEEEPTEDYDGELEDLDEDQLLLGLFKGRTRPDYRIAWEFYEKGREFNANIDLEETVRVNENFFIGKQWEGVPSNNLPTPQINILKRVGLFTIATIVSDNIKVSVSPLANTVGTSSYKDMARIINDEFEAIFERNKVPALIREFARNAAVDGDGCIYVYWDADAETGQTARGQIKCEIVDNTRVYFGNPSDVRVAEQPWIIIAKRMPERNARILARNNGAVNWRKIAAHPDELESVDEAKYNDELVTVLHLFWRDDATGEIWTYCSCENAEIEAPKSLGITHYPVCWLCWDNVKDSYHGQAMLTGLIPNQIAINKTHALTQVSMMNMSFPTKVYDQTRIKKVTNQVGAAYGVSGAVDNAMKVIEGANISPQVFQYIQSLIEQTEQSLGATSVALGDTRPDNTSAIIALQRAAATPSELTKQNIYSCIDDQLSRVFLDFMGEYYGIRYVDRPIKERERQAAVFAQQVNPDQEIPEEVPDIFDFSLLKRHPVLVRVDVGASTYYSEIASIQTLENLLMQGQITAVQFLERLPDDYVPNRLGLIAELKNLQMQQQQAAMGMEMPMPEAQAGTVMPNQTGQPGGGSVLAQGAAKMDVTGGRGYGAIQRAINQTGDTKGIL